MNALPLSSPAADPPARPSAGTHSPVRARPPALAWPAGSDTQPVCFRSEAFAEDLPDTGTARALPLAAAPTPARAAVRSALPATLAAAVLALLSAAAMGWWTLGIGA
jgi:hypothetical protein